MAKVTLDKFGTQRGPSLGGTLQMFSRNGVAIVSAWPRKRGKPKNWLHQDRVDFFTKANKLAKRADAKMIMEVRNAVAGTPWMPRDLWLSFMAGRFGYIIDPEQGFYRSRRAVVQTSFALDVITDVEGQGLYRGPNGWEGKTWPTGGGSGGTTNWWFDPPTASSLTVYTPDGANTLTLTDDTDAGLLVDCGAPVLGNHLRAAYQTLTTPTADWQQDFVMRHWMQQNNYSGLGPIAWESATGKAIVMMNGVNSRYQVNRFNTMTSYASTIVNVAEANPLYGLMFFRVRHETGILKWDGSPDGKLWQNLAFAPDAAWFTTAPDRIGFAVNYNSTATINNQLAVERNTLTGTAV